MAIQGLRATDSFDADARPLNWRAGILLNYPNGMTPLTGLTSLMRKRTVDDPEFNWWEQQLTAQRLQLTADIDDGTADDTLTVASDPAGVGEGGGLQVVPGHILRSEETGELMLVTGVTDDNTVVVVREFAGSTGVAIAFAGAGINPYLHVVGTAFEENSEAPNPVMYDPVKVRNYTQIFRNTLAASRTARATRLRTTDLGTESKRQAAELHALEIEKALVWSIAYEGVLNGFPHRTMDGIIARIAAANKIDAVADSEDATAPKLADIENWLEQCFRYGSSEKMAFCGNTAMLNLQRIIRYARGAQIQLMERQTEFGMKVNRLICPFGEVVLKTHPLFNQLVGGVTTAVNYYSMAASMIILDMSELTFVTLKDGDTRFERNLETPGQDGSKEGFLTECSLETHHPVNHMVISNLSTYGDESA